MSYNPNATLQLGTNTSNNSNTITNFYTGASAAREQSDYVAGDLYGEAHVQGPLTVIVRTSFREMKERQKRTGRCYPGGADPHCLQVNEWEPIIGPKGAGTGGRDFIWGFSSLNGVSFGPHTTVDALENSFHFIGFARSNHITVGDRSAGIQPDKHGFAVIAFGICTARQAWKRDIFPGDDVFWRFPSTNEAKEIMSNMSTTRHPANKLMVIMEPLDWSYLAYATRNAFQLVLRKANDIGISNRLGGSVNADGRYYDNNYGRSGSEESANIRTARVLKDNTLAIGAITAQVLATRGLVTINTPYKEKKNAAMLRLLNALLTYVKDTIKSEDVNALPDAQLKAALSTMSVNGKPLANGFTTDNPGIRSRRNTPQSEMIRAYVDYSDAVNAPKTDASTGVNVMFGDQFTQPYVHFSQNKHLAQRISNGTLYMENLNSSEEATKIDVEAKLESLMDGLYLEDYLGLVNGGKNEQPKVTYDILNAAHVGYGTVGTAVPYLKGAALGSTLGVHASEKMLTMLQESKKVMEEHTTEVMVEHSKLIQALQDKRIGKALSHATAGSLATPLDIGVKV